MLINGASELGLLHPILLQVGLNTDGFDIFKVYMVSLC